jgi:hypothetical protein
MSAAASGGLRRPGPAALVAALAASLAFGTVGGVRGAALGLGVGVVAALVPAPVGYLLGHCCLGLLSGELTWQRLVVLEAGLVPLLLPDLLRPLDTTRRGVAAVGTTLAVATLGAPAVWLVPPVGVPWTSVAVVVTATAAVGGVLWRYETVRSEGVDAGRVGETADE